jgi:hypothetical protein
LAGSKYYALSATADLLKQFIIAEVNQHRRGPKIDIYFTLGLDWAQTRLQQTGAAGVLRRIGRNGCSASATKFDCCDSHRARILFLQILHGNSPKVT